MAKARFPGKPPKLTPNSRIRVSVKSVDSKSDLPNDTVDQISLGLQLFRSLFEQNSQDQDFYGFVSQGHGSSSETQHSTANEESHVERDKLPQLPSVVAEDHTGRTESLTSSQPVPANCDRVQADTSKIQSQVREELSETKVPASQNEDQKAAKKGKKTGEKSPRKFILPSRSAHSSRPIIPNKRFLEELSQVEPKKCHVVVEEKDVAKDITSASHEKPKLPQDDTKTEKDKIKKEIARYTDIMMTERQADERRRLKEEKMREKIQQLLRSQWESRLSGDGNQRGESAAGRASSMSVSSEDDSPSCSSTSKVILREPRLQLSQRLLRQLRKPSQLQQSAEMPREVEVRSVTSIPHADAWDSSNPNLCPSPSVLRPPQLVVQAPSRDLPTQEPARTATPSVSSSEVRLSRVGVLMEQTGMNPLGCAFVTDTDHGEEKRIPGTVVCGVCGVVRKYSFILQARKFGTFSCEPCRKFISRILRNRTRVKCRSHSGQCVNPPVPGNALLRQCEDGSSSASESGSSRCEACRLKLALMGFRMKDSDHDELRKLLPLEMQSMVPDAAERHGVLACAPNRGQIIKIPPNSFSSETEENPAAERVAVVTTKGTRGNVIRERLDGGWSKKYVQHDSSWSVYVISPSGEKFRSAGELQRHREHGVQLDPRCFNFDPPAFNSQENVGRVLAEHCAGSRAPRTRTRTEAEVRGPRVKNVCRSAMVALGQPKALFDGRQQQQPQRLTAEEVQLCTDPVCVGCSQSKNDSACLTSPSATAAANNLRSLNANSLLSVPKNLDSSLVRPNNISEGEQSWATVDCRPFLNQQVASSAVRAYQSQKEVFSSLVSQSALGAKKFPRSSSGAEQNPLLSVSFWEAFDLHRTWEEGFPVLGAALGVAQLCYLCGSAGKEELVSCSGCCESFHPYCAGSSSVPPKGSLGKPQTQISPAECNDSNGCSIGEERATSACTSPQVWFCRRCRPCRVCQSSREFKLNCSLCDESYHSFCLPPAFPHPHPGTKEAWSCSACSRCRNCRETGTSRFVGPYLYCEKCHAEDVESKVCPLCLSSCGQDDAWLLECSRCRRWAHMKCQGFAEEDYYLLARDEQNRFVCELCVDKEGCQDVIRRLFHENLNSVLADLASGRPLRRGLQSRPEFQAKLARLQEKVAQNSYKTSLDFWQDLGRKLETFQVKSTLKELHHKYFPWSFPAQRAKTGAKTKPVGASSGDLSFDRVVGYQAESDWRGCLLCKRKGEGETNAEGRLLHCGNNEWIHINCILWSNEVFENADGGLQNVYAALNRGRVTRCTLCHHKGATLSCCVKSCGAAFHFPCALKSEIFLEEDKNIFCREHEPSSPRRKQTRFDVQRWVYVDMHEEIKRIKALPPKRVQLVIGSLKIKYIGELMNDVTASKAALYPANFRCERVFWSVKEPWKRTTYTICTKFVPGHCDTSEQDVNVTVSHEDEDVIMAESGLNIPEMETQEDSELIHMVLEDADFEQELVRGTTSGRSPPPEVRDSGFYSDAQSETSPCPVEQETNQSLEAWLADPEHAVILLDSALLATLDTMETNPLSEATSSDIPAPSCSDAGNDAQEITPTDQEPDSSSKRMKNNRRVSYSQWKKLRLENHRTKTVGSSRTALDWNGNEQQWSPGASSLLASIKVSPLVQMDAVEPVPRGKNPNILQLDGAADSSEAESDVPTAPLTSTTDEEPVKCSRCKRCYRTLQSFNKHAQTCDEVLSSSTSDEEAEESPPLKKDVLAVVDSNPIQVPIVNSSSQVTSTSSVEESNAATPAAAKTGKPRSRRKPKASPNTVRRPIAARVPFVPNGIQVVAPQPAPQLRTFHITIPQPIPAPTPQPQQHVVYVSNNVTSTELQQFPLAQPQPHLFVIPPVESTILHAPQLQPSATVYGASPLVQYYGSYPSELLTLGPVNMGLTPFSTLVPGMAALQCHIPWEATNVGPVIMLPTQQQPQPQQHPQHLPSYPIINTILPVETPNIIPVQPSPSQEVTPCVINIEQEPVLDAPHTGAFPQLETVGHVEDPAAGQSQEEAALEPANPLPETIVTYDALEEIDQDQEAADFVEDFEPDLGQPPPPTYSYRMAMNGEKKNPLTAALIAAAITTADLEPSEEPSPPFGTQQLKVTAESNELQRTFRIKATSTSEVPKGPHIVYELTSEDGFHASSASITDLWRQLLDAVQDARLAYKLEPLPDAVFPSEENDSLKVLGLNHPALRYLLEQLPNASSCANYEFLYHQPEPLASLTGSAFGCARTAPYSGRLPHDIFNWLASEHRLRPQLELCNGSETPNGSTGRRATNFDLLPMSARFRNLRQTSRYSVGVFRSGIHGRGLFCKRDFEAGEMVVEYAGEIIRSIVSDKREKEYEAKGIGCYMFRIDDQTVVDATLHGNSARFINHSCEPNCYSRIVDVQGKKQIVIFALRRIQRGEELTYDYKFPIEDVKIPCTCGSRRCRKYLN